MHACVLALARVRGRSASAVAEVNQRHAKMPRSLPTTEVDRCSAVAALDAVYADAIRASQEEREAVLLCIRTLEDLAKREGGTGRFSAGQPRAGDGTEEDASADEAPREAVRPADDPYAGEPNWGGRGVAVPHVEDGEGADEDEGAARQEDDSELASEAAEKLRRADAEIEALKLAAAAASLGAAIGVVKSMSAEGVFVL